MPEAMQTFTFWQLATQYKIEIPIVQRDYAQGRSDTKSKEIRDKFLEDLLKSLQNSTTPLELDFVFGKVQDDIFIPIDGQQRLTTLFLLHWYIAKRTQILDFAIKGFSYRTRISAKDFCKCLIKEDLQIITDEKLSNNIENAFWFFLSWKKDPTVQSMLNMLNSIHDKFKYKENDALKVIWERLITLDYSLPEDNPRLNDLIATIESSNDSKCINALNTARAKPNISFKFLNLEDFKLTDELYLKMNARGKVLSDFENFKAWMIVHVDKLCNNEFRQRWQNENEYSKHWHYLIDKSWTDWLWNNRYSNGNVNITNAFDNSAISFVRNIAFINYFLKENNKNSSKWKEIYTGYLNKNDLAVFYVGIYEECFNSTEACEFLFEAFSVLSQKMKLIVDKFSCLWEEDSLKFKSNILSNTSFKEKCYLYAIIQYYSFDIERIGFDKWFRVIRNLIENIDVIADNFKNILESILQLAKPETNLVDKLISPEILGFNTIQKIEETLKLTLINEGGAWEKQIIEAENHPLFKGNIGFLLVRNEKLEISSFTNNKSIASKLFDANGSVLGKVDYLTIRTIFCFCNENINLPIIIEDNRESWKLLLNNKQLQQGFINMIDTIKDDFENEFLKKCDLFDDKSNYWMYYLIKNPNVIKFLDKKKVDKYDSNHALCFLYNASSWSPRNVFISNNRNEIISNLILKHHFIFQGNYEWYNIDNKYFRDWNVTIIKSQLLLNDLKIVFERDKAIVSDGSNNPKEYTFTEEVQFAEKITADYPLYFY